MKGPDVNVLIAKLGKGIAEMVGKAGRPMSLREIREAFGCRDQPRAASAIGLAVERAVGAKRLEEKPRGFYRVPAPARPPRPREPRPKRPSKGPHRLRVLGRRRRDAVAGILEKDGGAMKSGAVHDALPPEFRPSNIHTFHRLLHFMAAAGQVVRLGQGRYAHPRHAGSAAEELERHRASLRNRRTREEVIDTPRRRRELMLDILAERGESIEIGELFAAVGRAGFGAARVSLHKDLAALRKDGRIERLRRGLYRAARPRGRLETEAA